MAGSGTKKKSYRLTSVGGIQPRLTGRHRGRGLCGLEQLEARLQLTTLPIGFTDTLVSTASILSAPTAMEISPLDEPWVLEQTGRVKLIRDDGTAHEAIHLTVDSSGERGLLGITFDPSYDGAGPNSDYVYLYYTEPRRNATDPANNRISRFTINAAGTTTPTLTGEVLIRELPPEDEDDDLTTNGNANHNGGAIHFGLDGKLYAAVGDHNYDNTPQSQHVSQVLDTPFGKMLRLNADGTNPSDNPFFTGSATDWEGAVWALGLRNPYTFAIDAATGRLFINDVGEGSWEEINLGVAGANYGWAGSTAPLWEGFENDATPPPWADYHDPQMAYDQSDSEPTPSGCAIAGGVFYPSGGGQFGSAYAGKYFFADLCGNFIRVFDPNDPGSISTPDTSTEFASQLDTSSPVDLKVDSAGTLYYVGRGGALRSISYEAPVITQHPLDQTVEVGEPTSFTVLATGAAPLGYQWQRFVNSIWTDIPGATSSTFSIGSAAAAHAGPYRVAVTNAFGSETSSVATLVVNASDRLAGDLNGDDCVTFADFLILQRNFGMAGSAAQGDLNDDGRISFSDFLIFQRNFGECLP